MVLVGTEKRMLRSKVIRVPILGNAKEVYNGGDGAPNVYPKRGLSLVATPPKVSHTGCHCWVA